MALIVITAHDTDHGLEVSAVWDKPIKESYLKSEELMKKFLTPAQYAALVMLHAVETMPTSKLILPKKDKVVGSVDGTAIEDFEDGRLN